MDCNTAKSGIFPYVDGELDAEARAAMEAHLVSCQECSRLIRLEFQFRDTYAGRLGPDAAPAHVQEGLRRTLAHLAAGPRRRAGSGWRPRLLRAAGGVLLVALGAAGALLADSLLRTRTALADLAEAAVDQHQRLSRDLLPADIRGVTPKGAEEWFRKRLAFNISVPDLPNDQLIFRGGRISHLQGVEAAALEYRVEGSDVSLFILPGESYQRLRLSELPRFKLITRRGYDVIVWQSHEKGIGYALVSEIGGRACLVCHAVDEVRESAANLGAHR